MKPNNTRQATVNKVSGCLRIIVRLIRVVLHVVTVDVKGSYSNKQPSVH